MKNKIKLAGKILFVLHIESSFPELLQVARLLVDSEGIKPVFFFDERFYRLSVMYRDINVLLNEGIEVLNLVNKYPDKPVGQQAKNHIRRFFNRIMPAGLTKKIEYSIENPKYPVFPVFE